MKYLGILKPAWDMLWHAYYQNKRGKLAWDRVTRAEARAIALKLTKPDKPAKKR